MTDLILLGDLALNGLFVFDKINNIKRIKEVAEVIDKSGFSICNLEVPVKGNDSDLNPDKNIYFYTDSDVVKEILPLLKIKVVSLANNHIGDYGISGVKNTIDILDELKIKHTGAGTKREHLNPVLFNISEYKVAFFAYVDKSTNPKTEKFKDIFINYFNLEKVIEDIDSIRKSVDKIICNIHWGKDYSRFFTKDQQIVARKIIDAGADIIMGHHPHTYQPYERYKHGLIFYSLGQLCLGDFIWEGKLRALKMKTKTAYHPIFNKDFELERFIKTKELKGNYIKSYNKNNFLIYNRFLLFINKKKNEYRWLNNLILIKENVFDRLMEYFFGYYRNPVKQLFKFTNLHKISYIKRDLSVKEL